MELKPCPFCGGTHIEYSDKTTTINYVRKRHVAMYCKTCNCYGARSIVTEVGEYPYGGSNGREVAEAAWNKRDVEIVRCANCVRWNPDARCGYGYDLDGTKRRYGICDITKLPIKENGYCYYGSDREVIPND